MKLSRRGAITMITAGIAIVLGFDQFEARRTNSANVASKRGIQLYL